MVKEWLIVWDAAVCHLAWWVACLLALPTISRAPRKDLLSAAALGAAAFALRLPLARGPLNFGEAERLGILWQTGGFFRSEFATTTTGIGQLEFLGLSLADTMRIWGPLMGALAVMMTYACARAFVLPRVASVLAGVLVAVWPAHLHYSSAPTFSVDASAFIPGTLAVAASISHERLRVPLLAALTVLAVHSRPELRLIVLPLSVLVLGPSWTWRERGQLALVLGVALLGYVPAALSGASETSGCFASLIHTYRVRLYDAGLLWGLLALAGVVWAPIDRRIRIVLGGTLLLFSVVYSVVASDQSQNWMQWRYFVTLVPVCAISASGAVMALARKLSPRATLAAAFILALFPLAAQARTVWALNDQQAEFAFVRETAPTVLNGRSDVYFVSSPASDIPESAAALGLTTVFGQLNVPIACTAGHQAPSSGRLGIRYVDRMLRECRHELPSGGAVLYLGTRNRQALADLSKQVNITPLNERTQTVAADHSQGHQNGCEYAETGAHFPVTMGWYLITPRD